ncbi:XRE family transcriptional regulator [Xylanimonas allomyrinae]|uniref:XRE family transcriptional regulator n=1 Tax=Xylanimonas allomyrinae TaxID=2509459 RepID=A0A4P6F1L6_9MICO|nr:helix-turn-helix transcriptional regulator [Xylanimonas allomyrinae]QAY64228.1 XRE family transcriptional regulator [Xylanimonas allomyrinae]
MWVKDPELIRWTRQQRRYTQRDLAFLVRRSQAAIYAVEAGKLRSIGDDFALAIAQRLDVPWELLFQADSDGETAPASPVRRGARRASSAPAAGPEAAVSPSAGDDPGVASRREVFEQ